MLATPGDNNTFQLDLNAERICVDTGASACISTKKGHLTALMVTPDEKINGIAAGLCIEGIGTLKWSIYNDSNNEIDLYIKDALYVPSAPMGLLCPQQVVQPTKERRQWLSCYSKARHFGIRWLLPHHTI
jgi:hypothetical protein